MSPSNVVALESADEKQLRMDIAAALRLAARNDWHEGVAPTAMVMCPSVGGLSHNEAEEISKEWAGRGADVLFHAVVETAEIVG